MYHFQTSVLSILLSLLLSFPVLSHGQTPAPAVQTQFALPLADKTTATAILLPMPTPGAWLVYATPSGKLGLFQVTPASPDPNPDPTPVPPTPVPPTPVPPTPLPPNVLPPLPDWIIPGNARQDRSCKGGCKWK